ncbi:MAG: SOS response-associated peptidase [Planctomycetota bacterium]|jgi:putative SOS response-associated peptidase YedK
MCGRFVLVTPVEVLARIFGIGPDVGAAIPTGSLESYNIAPTQMVPVVRQSAAGRTLERLKWGLVPSWADDPSVGVRMINARSETAASKPAFKEAMRQRRCVVPASGFYEWKQVGGRKQPWYLFPADGELMAFAGLWERWGGPRETLETFTILTRDATPGIADLHDRMPVVLQGVQIDDWLDPSIETPSRLMHCLEAAPDDLLMRRRVSRRVNHVGNNDPSLLDESDEGFVEEQGSLFD